MEAYGATDEEAHALIGAQTPEEAQQIARGIDRRKYRDAGFNDAEADAVVDAETEDDRLGVIMAVSTRMLAERNGVSHEDAAREVEALAQDGAERTARELLAIGEDPESGAWDAMDEDGPVGMVRGGEAAPAVESGPVEKVPVDLITGEAMEPAGGDIPRPSATPFEW
jgi:hypothetical protein